MEEEALAPNNETRNENKGGKVGEIRNLGFIKIKYVYELGHFLRWTCFYEFGVCYKHRENQVRNGPASGSII